MPILRALKAINRFAENNEAKAAAAETTWFKSSPHGPVTAHSTPETTTATAKNGLTVVIAGSNRPNHFVDQTLLRNGVEVAVNGELSAHLVQQHHKSLRSQRILKVVPVPGNAHFTQDLQFRLRRWISISLETPNGDSVLRASQTTKRLHVSGTPNAAIVCLFTTIFHGFYTPITGGVTTERDES